MKKIQQVVKYVCVDTQNKAIFYAADRKTVEELTGLSRHLVIKRFGTSGYFLYHGWIIGEPIRIKSARGKCGTSISGMFNKKTRNNSFRAEIDKKYD